MFAFGYGVVKLPYFYGDRRTVNQPNAEIRPGRLGPVCKHLIFKKLIYKNEGGSKHTSL
jgi:hypothetical protein